MNIQIHFISYFFIIRIYWSNTRDICWYSIFVSLVDTLSVTLIISSHAITESSEICFKYLPFSQVHVLGLQLIFFFLSVKYFLHSHWYLSLFHFFIWFTCYTIEFAFTVRWNMFFQCFDFMCSCYIKYFNFFIFCFTQNTFLKGMSSAALNLQLHLSRLIMNG